jgi:Flp pilus assembly protein TadG
MRLRRDDRGEGALDISVMATCFFVPCLLLLIYAGRMNSGHAAVESAARHAARTISIARDPTQALGVAEDDAALTVRLGSALCESMDFDPVIGDGEVTVTVTCQVDLSELALLPVPGTATVSATATEVIDRHREGVVP